MSVRPVEALYENGVLRPAKPLNLKPGERVGLIVVRHPDGARWVELGFRRFKVKTSTWPTRVSTTGLPALDREDRGCRP